jgi:hypothetical protein
MIEEIVSNWLNKIQKDLVLNYDRLGLRASGEWEESLEQFKELSGGVLKFGILGADYTVQLEQGRRPNKNQSEDALKAWVGWAGSTFLKEWVEVKNIDASPYAIAWKIAREGWQVPNPNNAGGLVSDVVNRENLLELNREITLSIIEDFKNGFRKTFR